MEKQQQDSNVSQLSLDERFSEKGRRSSARLRHQSLDRGMDRPSLNRRFGGKEDEQLPMTAPHCRIWQQKSEDEKLSLRQPDVQPALLPGTAGASKQVQEGEGLFSVPS